MLLVFVLGKGWSAAGIFLLLLSGRDVTSIGDKGAVKVWKEKIWRDDSCSTLIIKNF